MVDPTELEVFEGESGTFSVELAGPPTADVTVSVTSGDTSAATVLPASLTFTTENWNSIQTVTVEAVGDADTDNEEVTVTLSASGGDYAGQTGTVSVRVVESDFVRFGAPSYTAVEGGLDATVQVQLQPAPTSPVTIGLVASRLGGATAADYSGIPSSLTFGVGETVKTFTVTAIDDGDDDDGERVQIFFANLPEGLRAADPAVTIVALQDDDFVGSVSFDRDTYTAARRPARPRESSSDWVSLLPTRSPSRCTSRTWEVRLRLRLTTALAPQPSRSRPGSRLGRSP